MSQSILPIYNLCTSPECSVNGHPIIIFRPIDLQKHLPAQFNPNNVIIHLLSIH